MSVIGVDEVKARLNQTVGVNDGEIEDMIDAAEDEYAELIGPLTGTVTERHHGGRTSIILRNPSATEVTAAVYDDGTVIDVADLDLDPATGIVHWGYNTAGSFTYGSRNVTITYTVSLPANHRETIIADVAGYFAATQRGGSSGPRLPGEGYGEAYDSPGTPLTLFPRINALAGRMPSIA